jgi:hypothetical protein
LTRFKRVSLSSSVNSTMYFLLLMVASFSQRIALRGDLVKCTVVTY